MPINFKPNFTNTPRIIHNLLRIQAVKHTILHLPLTPAVLRSLRETARLYTTHYSTMIEGNKLDLAQIANVLKNDSHFPGRQRDEYEVKSYYVALTQVEQWVAAKVTITEKMIRQLHALVMSHGKINNTPTEYRDAQNVIRDSSTGSIVYMPPQAQDVPELMQAMVQWLRNEHEHSCPIVAAIIHYQFATIHPYFDGNGRTARLLTTLILHLGGYDLKGLYSLEEYYAQNLPAYYEAISIGTSHNYYMGRAEADITKWIEYFIEGMAVSFENVSKRMQKEQHRPDASELLKTLEPRQRKTLELFIDSFVITSSQVGHLFGFQPRTASKLCADWVKDGFLEIVNPSNKARTYKLGKNYTKLV
ncbi:MAG: Fic family protein [Candidatus Chromulinivorax sp.]|nr:Fic family protein [Candidatus Chromulinivorax sp.]